MPGTRTARPDPARIYDALLGGRSNYAADREAADAIEARCPGMKALVRAHREFLVGAEKRDGAGKQEGAVRWLARNKGIRQFIDIGSGLPSRKLPGAGQVAREVYPDARVACVNAGPVTVHVRVLLGGAAVAAPDLGRAGDVMADPGLREVIDLAEPCGVLLAGVLGSMDAGRAREAVEGYAAALVPGSAVAISCVSYADQAAGDEAAAAYREATGGRWYSHSAAAIEGFFAAAGLELARGRVMDTRCWPVCRVGESRAVAVLGGIGLKR